MLIHDARAGKMLPVPDPDRQTEPGQGRDAAQAGPSSSTNVLISTRSFENFFSMTSPVPPLIAAALTLRAWTSSPRLEQVEQLDVVVV
jgi:hypothetical protein